MPPFWRSAFAKRTARSAACAPSRSGLYRRSLLDIVIDAEAGSSRGAGPRDVLSLLKASGLTNVATIERLIGPEVKALGYDLVRVAMIGGTSDPTLQVMAERPDTRQLDLSDCERISRH